MAALLAFGSVSIVFAETYHIKDGLKYMLEEDDAYLAGIVDDRTALDVPAYMYLPELRTTELLLMFLRICMTIP